MSDPLVRDDRLRLRVAAEIEVLIAEAADAHPGLGLHELATKLPEPQQSRLRELLWQSRQWLPFPVEVEP